MKLRIWRLGSLEHRVSPGPRAFQRLREIVQSLRGKGGADIIWDEALSVEEIDLDMSTGLDVFVSDGEFTDVLRKKIQQLITEEFRRDEPKRETPKDS